MNLESKISFADFQKIEIAVGRILSAEKVPATDKLLKLVVDFGQKLPLNPPLKKEGEESTTTPQIPSLEKEGREEKKDIRQIISGVAAYFPDPQTLVGKKCMFVTNIAPRVIKGLESNGMLFAVSTEGGTFSLLEPNADIPEGTRAK